jgi:thiol-disulfide isomerase/thioredoxin
MVTEITPENMKPGGMPEDDDMHVVMFYGATCGPCKFTMPFYEEAASKFISKGAKIQFHKLHAWENDEIREECKILWNVKGVPTFKFFVQGVMFHEKTGGGKLEDVEKMIHEAIDKAYRQYGSRI